MPFMKVDWSREEYAQSERISPTRYGDEPIFLF